MASLNDARARLLLKRPYYAAMLMRVRFVKKPGYGTLGITPKLNCYYDPVYCDSLTLAQLTAVLEHELNHPLRFHHGRMGGRPHLPWNVACDMEINDGIADLPPGCMTPARFGLADGDIAENYFDKLPKDDSGGGCGSPSATGQMPEGAEDEAEGLSPVEVEAIQKEVAKEVQKAAGNAPGSLRRWATERLSIRPVPWYHILSRGLSNTVARSAVATLVRYPGRRNINRPFLFPRWRGTRPIVAAVIDTSGSIGDEDLAIAIKVVTDMSEHADPIIFSCDTEAHRVHRLVPESLIGGGGTDMGAGIEASVKEGKGRLSAIVVITDCWTPWPEQSPGVPVFVVTRTPNGDVPKWARVITINT